MKPRICIIRHRGYELPVRREAEALVQAGYDVDVIGLREPGHPFMSYEDGVRLFRVPLSRERGGVVRYLFDYVAFLLASAILVSVLHLRHRYAAVQSNTMPDALAFASIVPKLLGAKAVVFMKEPSPELAAMSFGSERVVALFHWMERAALRYADHAFTVTQQLKDVFVQRGASADKIDVILNGPDPSHLLGPGTPTTEHPAGFTLVCHGTVEERYGHQTLIDAVALARQDVDDLHLVITGSGSDVDALCARIDELGLKDTVSYLGHVPLEELRTILRSADAGVVPMRSNPYSNLVHTNKMYDYMLLSKPVIATALDSVAAYFDDGAIALVTPDDPRAMADAIVRLAKDPELRTSLAARASELYREYGWDRQRELYVEAFNRLLGRTQPQGAAR